MSAVRDRRQLVWLAASVLLSYPDDHLLARLPAAPLEAEGRGDGHRAANLIVHATATAP